MYYVFKVDRLQIIVVAKKYICVVLLKVTIHLVQKVISPSSFKG